MILFFIRNECYTLLIYFYWTWGEFQTRKIVISFFCPSWNSFENFFSLLFTMSREIKFNWPKIMSRTRLVFLMFPRSRLKLNCYSKHHLQHFCSTESFSLSSRGERNLTRGEFIQQRFVFYSLLVVNIKYVLAICLSINIAMMIKWFSIVQIERKYFLWLPRDDQLFNFCSNGFFFSNSQKYF